MEYTSLTEELENKGVYQLNSMSVSELFERYTRLGFLYPEKRERLAPEWSNIVENWRRGLSLGEAILWIATYEYDGAWASVSAWRHTYDGWHGQHIVGSGGPRASLAVLLEFHEAATRRAARGAEKYRQAWYQPDKPFARRVFGTMQGGLGSEHVDCHKLELLSYGVRSLVAHDSSTRVTRVSTRDMAELVELVSLVRGSLFADLEEIDDDVELEATDELYRRAGLRRWRRIYAASESGRHAARAAAIVHVGPVGFSFSGLQSRCDILVDPRLGVEEKRAHIGALLSVVAPVYAEAGVRQVMITTERENLEVLQQLGARCVRCYERSAWRAEVYPDVPSHFARCYAPVIRALDRRAGRAKSEFRTRSGRDGTNGRDDPKEG